MDFSETLVAIAKLGDQAQIIVAALDKHMLAEHDPVMRGLLHRWRGACLELAQHATQAMQAHERHAA